MSNAINILTPTGRLVAGSVYEPQTKDQSGAPLVIKTGPDAGKPTQKFYFGLALAKTKPAWWDEPWAAAFLQAASQGFPQFAAGYPPSFAWKVTDGDSAIPNKAGRKPCDNEGYPGHWVLNFSSTFPSKIYNNDGSAFAPEGAVKLGYFIQVAGSVVANGQLQNPGVYLNHSMVALQGYGPEISRGPDAAAVGFGKGPAPSAMQAVPPGAFTPPAVPGASPAAPGPVAPVAPPVAPVAVQPHPAFVTGPGAPPPAAGAPPPPPAAAPPPPPAGPQMTPKAAGMSYESFIAKGWTDATLRQHGYMV